MFNRGITKIEILISVAVALLVIIVDLVVIVYLNNKKFDIQVLSEVSQIRTGLDQFLIANNYYPITNTASRLNDSDSLTEKLCLEGFKRLSEQCTKNILNPIPNFYLNSGNSYYYQSTNENKDYLLQFDLKTNFKKLGLIKGSHCADSNQIKSGPCF